MRAAGHLELSLELAEAVTRWPLHGFLRAADLPMKRHA